MYTKVRRTLICCWATLFAGFGGFGTTWAIMSDLPLGGKIVLGLMALGMTVYFTLLAIKVVLKFNNEEFWKKLPAYPSFKGK